MCNFSYTKLTTLYKHWAKEHKEYIREMEQSAIPESKQNQLINNFACLAQFHPFKITV